MSSKALESPARPDGGQIITFYSYKGGVGRSMALANIAALLVQEGRRVLVMDCDLEAPGLHRYFFRPNSLHGEGRSASVRESLGVIEFFGALRLALDTKFPDEASYLPEHSTAKAAVREVVCQTLDDRKYYCNVDFNSPAYADRRSRALDFIPAGRFDDAYPERVQGFNWDRFYSDYAEVFPILAEELKKRYDMILIDSRTGISDVGSVCTVLLPDKLVLCFSANEQSLSGAVQIGKQSLAQRRASNDRRPLGLFPLPGRLENAEQELQRHWLAKAQSYFEEILFEDTELTHDLTTYFEQIRIPHQSYYAYGEEIAAERDSPTVIGSLTAAFDRLRQCIRYPSLERVQWSNLGGVQDAERHSDAALEMDKLATAYRALGKVDEAINLNRQALTIRLHALGETHPDTVMALGNLGAAYRDLGYPHEALKLCLQALDICRKVFGLGHPDTAAAMANLGLTYIALGQPHTALDLETQALMLLLGLRGEKHRDTAVAYLNLGSVYRALGEWRKELEHEERALDICRSVLGEKDPETAKALSNLSVTFSSLGQPKKALSHGERALAIFREVFGETHPTTAAALSNLATIYITLGQPEKALGLALHAVDIRRELTPKHPENATVMGVLGMAYRSLGRLEEALKLEQAALAIRREVLGEKHPDTAKSFGNLGTTYRLLGQRDEALKLAQQALSILQETLGDMHPDTATALGNLSVIYRDFGQLHDALSLAQQALELRREVLGPSHPATATALYNLSTVYTVLRQHVEAYKLAQQALSIRREVLGSMHPETAEAHYNLANVYSSLGMLEESFRDAAKALDIFTVTMGKHHPDALKSRLGVANCLIMLNRRAEALSVIRDGLLGAPNSTPESKALRKLESRLTPGTRNSKKRP